MGHRRKDLSHVAFQALTGGSLDPPGQFNIEWYVAIGERCILRMNDADHSTGTAVMSMGSAKSKGYSHALRNVMMKDSSKRMVEYSSCLSGLDGRSFKSIYVSFP